MKKGMSEYLSGEHSESDAATGSAHLNCSGWKSPSGLTSKAGVVRKQLSQGQGAWGRAGGNCSIALYYPSLAAQNASGAAVSSCPAQPGCWQLCPPVEACQGAGVGLPCQTGAAPGAGGRELPPPAPDTHTVVAKGRERALTIPFCTLKPSWYLRSGRLMRTVVTGGQLTMLSFTCVWFFRPYRAWGQESPGTLVASAKAPSQAWPRMSQLG